MPKKLRIALIAACIVYAVATAAVILMPLAGCAPTVKQVHQRTYDEWPKCERCGDVATENVSEVADEEWWRCPKCVPRDVRPRQTPKPRKLERNIV